MSDGYLSDEYTQRQQIRPVLNKTVNSAIDKKMFSTEEKPTWQSFKMDSIV